MHARVVVVVVVAVVVVVVVVIVVVAVDESRIEIGIAVGQEAREGARSSSKTIGSRRVASGRGLAGPGLVELGRRRGGRLDRGGERGSFGRHFRLDHGTLGTVASFGRRKQLVKRRIHVRARRLDQTGRWYLR